MKKISVIAAILAAAPATAQMSDASDDAAAMIQANSDVCGFTFFSDGDDRIDLRGQKGRPCFDLKSGRDILGLDPENFPDGTDVFTGPGRDIVLLTDGNDVVVSFDDADEEIILRGGDDKLRIHGVIAEGLARPGRSEKTLVKPGSGKDSVIFEMEGLRDVVRLRSPNIIIDPDGSGSLVLDMHCGRYLDARTIDLTIPSSGKTKSTEATLKGCGAAFNRQAAPLRLMQEGGRLNLSVRSPAYELEHQPVKVEADVTNGAAISGSFEISGPDSNLSWQGYGVAAMNLDFVDDRMGGAFEIESDETFYGTVDLSRGNASLHARAGEVAELVMMGGLGTNAMKLSLAAPRVILSWYPSAGKFPEVEVPNSASYKTVDRHEEASDDQVISALEKNYSREMAAFEGTSSQKSVAAVSKEARRQARSNDVVGAAPEAYSLMNDADKTEALYSAKLVRPIPRSVQVQVERVDFRIHRSGKFGCFDVSMRDRDGGLPERIIACEDPVAVEDARNYEVIEVTRDDHNIKIDINGDSGFRVDRLMLRN